MYLTYVSKTDLACKICQGHPRAIILSNYDGLKSPMLNTKFCGNRPTSSGDLLRFFTIYERGSHLGHDQDFAIKISVPLLDRPSIFRDL